MFAPTRHALLCSQPGPLPPPPRFPFKRGENCRQRLTVSWTVTDFQPLRSGIQQGEVDALDSHGVELAQTQAAVKCMGEFRRRKGLLLQ